MKDGVPNRRGDSLRRGASSGIALEASPEETTEQGCRGLVLNVVQETVNGVLPRDSTVVGDEEDEELGPVRSDEVLKELGTVEELKEKASQGPDVSRWSDAGGVMLFLDTEEDLGRLDGLRSVGSHEEGTGPFGSEDPGFTKIRDTDDVLRRQSGVRDPEKDVLGFEIEVNDVGLMNLGDTGRDVGK